MDNEKIEELRKKIIGKLNEEAFISNNEYISFFDLVKICNNEIGVHSKYFKNNIFENMTKINRKTKLGELFGRESFYICEVVPYVSDNKSCVDILFSNNKGKYAFEMKMENEKYILTNGKCDLDNEKNVEYLDNCYNTFKPFIYELNEFKESNPNIDFKWDFESKKEDNKLKFNDGFLCGGIDLYDTSRSYVTLNDVSDLVFSTIKTKKYGTLYDYIDFFNDSFKQRFVVNIDELPENIKSIVKNHLNTNNYKLIRK